MILFPVLGQLRGRNLVFFRCLLLHVFLPRFSFEKYRKKILRTSVPHVQLDYLTSNGNRTEWSPIRSVIIRVITKSDDRAAGVRFVYHEYDYRPNWTTRSPIAN